jgi:hypothetical protein
MHIYCIKKYISKYMKHVLYYHAGSLYEHGQLWPCGNLFSLTFPTSSTKQNPFRQGDFHPSAQEIPHFLWYLKSHYRIPPLECILWYIIIFNTF